MNSGSGDIGRALVYLVVEGSASQHDGDARLPLTLVTKRMRHVVQLVQARRKSHKTIGKLLPHLQAADDRVTSDVNNDCGVKMWDSLGIRTRVHPW